MNIGQLIEFALGPEQARKVDTSIPQQVFDRMAPTARDDIAGWYYGPEDKIFGRLLTREECWQKIHNRLLEGTLQAFMGDTEVGYVACHWPCLRYHANRDEITFKEGSDGSHS